MPSIGFPEAGRGRLACPVAGNPRRWPRLALSFNPMIFQEAPLALKDATPIAKGGIRLVYPFPGNPDWLIKVMKPEVASGRYGESGTWFRRNRRYGHYILFMREIREYVAACASHGGSAPFVHKITGLVDTDLGLGLVMEAARDAEGNLAPTAAKLIFEGRYDDRAAAALDQFLKDILESNVVFADLHERNIVYARGKDGQDRFVMIDGLGSSTFLPFKTWNRAINRRSKQKRIERLRKRIEGRLEAYRSGNPIP